MASTVRRLLTLTLLAVMGWAPVAGASPITYYFEAAPFTDLPEPIPTDEPTFCDDNIRHAQTNCGVSFVSMLFTVDSDDLVPGEFHSAPMTDWWVFDGATYASEGTNYHASLSAFGADASGTVTSLFVVVSSDFPERAPGAFSNMTMLWDPDTDIPNLGVLNITGRYCLNFIYCNDPSDYADFWVRNTLDPDTSPRATVTQVVPVPEPAALSLLGVGLLALPRARRWHSKFAP